MTATILVVEDVRLIRDLVSEALHRDGHQVLEGCDGLPLPKLIPSSRNGMTSLGLPSFIAKTKTACGKQTLTPKVSALIYGDGKAESDQHMPQASTRICCEIQLHCQPTGFGMG